MRAFAFVCALSLALGAPAWAAPQRVASLNLCTDELLLALASPGQIASVTHLAHNPREHAGWRKARAFAANDGSLISVVRLRPDLVIDMGGGGSAAIAQRLGIRTLTLPYPAGLEDIARSIRAVAAALGREQRGAILEARIGRLRQSRPPRSLDSIWLGGGGRSVSATGLAAQWMALAGLRQRRLAGDRVALEQLLLRPPLILLRSDYRDDQVSSEQRWLRHPLARGLGRSRNLTTDGRPWTCMGPSMVDEVVRLRRRLGP